ncbi:MAG: peptidase S15, partial [Mycobacterium sp.]|nr:peptidase S15 [Mycobacterium sp.]
SVGGAATCWAAPADGDRGANTAGAETAPAAGDPTGAPDATRAAPPQRRSAAKPLRGARPPATEPAAAPAVRGAAQRSAAPAATEAGPPDLVAAGAGGSLPAPAPPAVAAAKTAAPEPLTVDPTVEFVDGIVQGRLNATSQRFGETSCSQTQTSSCLTYQYLSQGATAGKLDIGTVPVSPTARDPQSFTALPYLTWDLDTGAGKGTQSFEVRVTEVTEFSSILTGLPLVGTAAGSVIAALQQTALLGALLAPIIGGSVLARIDADLAALAPGTTPVAFTYKVSSFDGTPISTNFFPASTIAAGEVAPTVLRAPGLAGPGATDPYASAVPGTTSASIVPPVKVLRGADYNVITWDQRGTFASGGILQMDNPFYEGRDVSALISWAAGSPLVELDDPGDPVVGMVGGSYGGGVQLPTAGIDPRVDALVPSITWASLISSLYPDDIFKSSWSAGLLLALVNVDARLNSQIYSGILTGLLFNRISESAQAVLISSGPTALLSKITAPTLLLQSTVDGLFPPSEAAANAQAILANPFGTPVKMIWFCGAHGYCLDPSPAPGDLIGDSMAWLDTYVGRVSDAAAAIPTFQWWDQTGTRHTSAQMPFDPGFNEPTPYTATGEGGVLPIVPLIGGSGPLRGPDTLPPVLLGFPLNQTFATPATNAVNTAVKPPAGSQIVGAPQLSFSYRGVGTGKAVFAQLVDDATGRVVGNMVTAIPVTLDGRPRSVSIPLQDIAYTAGVKDSLTLQIVGYSSLYFNSSVGVIDISDVVLDLPLRDLTP